MTGIHADATQRAFRAFGLPLLIACVALVITVAVGVFVVVRQAQTTDCINTVLGDRNDSSLAVTRTNIRLQGSDHAYNEAEKALYAALADRAPLGTQEHLFAALRATQARKDTAQAAYRNALVAQRNDQVQHPLGKC